MSTAPKPYAGEKKWWNYDDPGDVLLPKVPGFLHDFVAHTRGYEAPTAYCIWSAIFFIAAAIKREAWLEWADDKLFPNFYIIFVGPPGIVKKGTAINRAYSVFRKCPEFIAHPMRGKKDFKLLKNKASPEALITAMLPTKKGGGFVELKHPDGAPLTHNGKAVRYYHTSEITMVVTELATMIGKQDYAKATTELLMDIYDPHEEWEYTTQKRGKEKLVRVCTNFIGAVTPKGLQQSIPEVAMEDGFLSRCILVFQRKSVRRFSVPRKSGPTEEDLSKRLAWIAENVSGEHVMEESAKKFYDAWYERWKDDLENNIEHPYASSRMDIQALKLAVVLKAARYDAGKYILLQDVKDAVRILEATAKTYPNLFYNVNASTFHQKMDSISQYIKRKKKVTRAQLLQSAHLTADEASVIVNNLLQSDKIEIKREGVVVDYPSRSSKELYIWTGNGYDEEEGA